MLDPLSALGLASNIAQLLSIGAQAASQAHEFLQSSSETLPLNEALIQLAKDNKELASNIGSISSAGQPLTQYETAARDAAAHCSREAASLLAELESLQVKRQGSKLITGMRAMSQSLRTVTKRHTLESLQKKLQARESQLGTALLQLILHHQDVKFDELKRWIEFNNVRDGSSILRVTDDITRIVVQQQQRFNEESRLIQDGLERIESRHDKTDFDQKVDKILQSLRFADMEYRKHVIPESHQKTLEWSFDSNLSPIKDWLEHANGIFWIYGKAGSGKSTFMKFLCDHRRTRNALRTWSTDRTLIFVEHYFWYAGTALQKSHQGLLQSILYQILSSGQNSELVSILCNERLAQDYADMSMKWSREELVTTIQSVQKCTNVSVCVFIDGLDEYYPHGNHVQLVTELKALANITNLKLCVSSRPWNAFLDAFGELPTRIRLEKLTRPDIGKYVKDHLQAAASAAKISKETLKSSDINDLVRLVTSKAQGVFLWVQLVVSALEERLAARNNLQQLLRCVEEFPAELENYFRHAIYDRIHKTFRNDTAQALKLALVLSHCREALANERTTSEGNMRLGGYTYSFLPFWLLHEGIDTTDFGISMKMKHVTRQELNDMVLVTIKHLNACCKDLLCVIASDKKKWTLPKPSRQMNHTRNYRVEFLHRTVHDFLCSEEMSSLLDSNVPPCFKDKAFLLNIAVACIKVVINDDIADPKQSVQPKQMDLCLDFAETTSVALLPLPKGAQGDSDSSYLPYATGMKELDHTGIVYTTTLCDSSCWKRATAGHRSTHLLLLQHLIGLHLYSYAQAFTIKSSMILSTWWWGIQTSSVMLLAALGLSAVHPFPLNEVDFAFVKFLLDHGANPNAQAFDSNDMIVAKDIVVYSPEKDTVWQCFLAKWLRECQARKKTGAAVELDCVNSKHGIWAVVVSLLAKGADLGERHDLGNITADRLAINPTSISDATAEAFRTCVPRQHRQDLQAVLNARQSDRPSLLKSMAASLESSARSDDSMYSKESC